MKKTLGFIWGIIFFEILMITLAVVPWFQAKNHSLQTFQLAVIIEIKETTHEAR